ncbi:choice-of-anchor Q domain-containing protein [Flavimarina sp. Hel_I_48]|uniref:choice-of-anchor Q domain-containing protein n=1 Tax=Flavimarina sp. Hel_I_48 TaxID=1392488 RepID=UPI0004DFCAA3|nr:choice-of-anchor Q domain-containing protein [Flavimarina sp. Hel_I_48]
MYSKITRLGLVFGLCSLFFYSTISAQLVTKNVDDGSDGTLRQEIADTPPGGTITFAAGIETILLNEELLIEKELTISADSTMRVNLDAQMGSRIFNITEGPVTLNNLSLVNGFTPLDNGGAIKANNTDIILNFIDISNCQASNGGGVFITGDSDIMVNYGTVSENMGYVLGGGFYIEAKNATFTNVVVDGNGSDSAGGGIYNSGGNLNISSSTISNNSFTFSTDVRNDGAGIYNSGGNLNVFNSLFSHNDSRNFGGAIYSTSGNFIITNSQIDSNYAQFGGGGVSVFSTESIMFTNVSLNGNSGENPVGGQGRNNGGAIYAMDNSSFIINGGFIENNSSYHNGGGIAFGGGTLITNGTRIANNIANIDGLGIGGGGIYYDSGQLIINAGTQFIENSVFSNNNTDFEEGGGGILVQGEGSLTINSPVENPVIFQGNVGYGRGGAIAYGSAKPLDLNNVIFTANTALYGGALHTIGAGAISIFGGDFSRNGQGDYLSREGGAIWNITATLNINETLFSSNYADDKGGALYNYGGTLNISNSRITQNTSFNGLGLGGGIFNDYGGSLSIFNSEVSNNGAVNGGGGITDDSTFGQGSVNLNQVVIRNNYANGQSGKGGGLYFIGNANAVLKSVEISDNNADNQGGGIWNGATTINCTTSTISGNFTSGAELEESNDGNGGAIYNFSGSIFIGASTVVMNNADGNGGAMYNGSAATTTLKNTIVALNTAEEGNNLAGETSFISADYNLIGEDDLNLFPAMSNDLEGTSENPINPMINVLADNGGYTRTHALLEGSPSFNAGNPIDTFPDQRGEMVFAGRRDIGAFEAQTELSLETITRISKSTLYPNPSQHGDVQLTLAEPMIDEVNISIIEIGSGKLISEQLGKSGTNTLKTANLMSGLYLVRLVAKNKVESLKLLVSN